jgi:hypothetical protein
LEKKIFTVYCWCGKGVVELRSVYGGVEQGVVHIAAVVYPHMGPYYSTLAALGYTVLPVDYFDGVE